MRISDWSSDVCSSDLLSARRDQLPDLCRGRAARGARRNRSDQARQPEQGGLSGGAPSRLRLGVNIDHVATIRTPRGGEHPAPVRAAETVAPDGRDGLTEPTSLVEGKSGSASVDLWGRRSSNN